jgi:hypothetical protein
MAEPHALRELPEHLAVVRALSRLEFEFAFDPQAEPQRADRIMGFAPESVVEVVQGPPLVVALLFSASLRRPSLIRSTMSVVTLASVLGLDYTSWLSREIERKGLVTPWKSTRRFGSSRVSAEYLTKDAVLLTIEGATSD